MIITQLLGGLGNQLFQYAIGRALAVRHGTELRLDTTAFDGYPLRTYALDHLFIEGTLLSDAERRAMGIRRAATSRLGRLAERLFGAATIPVVRERRFEFDPEVLDAPETCYLQGYWQSPRYFAGVEAQIRRELSVRDPLAGQNLEVAGRIAACPAVSVHVRRGDYAANPVTNRYHGTCGPEYYAAAEALLQGEVGDLRLFVFSDDPDWAVENLRFRSPVTVLRHNGPERDYEDLRLMTLCRHHIIANSTFSWWGAWLCPHPGKIVVAPKIWFKQANHGTADLIPQEWRRI